MSNRSAEGHVTCLCNHLTSFAVLVHVSIESRPVRVVLDIITGIGCVLSIIGLFICVVTTLAINCFLRPGLEMYLGFILLIILMSVFNTKLFFMVSCKFAGRPVLATDDEKKRKEMAFRLRGIILFWLLMGMSWIFGLLAAIPSPFKILFGILFSILMALQGFAMFYLLTVTNPEVKKFLERFNCFGENIFSLRRGRSTTKTTQRVQKSQSNDQSGQSSAVVTDT